MQETSLSVVNLYIEGVLMFPRLVSSTVIATCFVLAACGGGGSSSSPPVSMPPPAPPPPPPPSSDVWEAVKTAVDVSPITDMRLIIGDSTGVIFQYEKGSLPGDEVHRIASSSKLLTGLTLMRLVEAGDLSLDDNPQDYLTGWTSNPADNRSKVTLEQALSFTTGFNASPLQAGCILQIFKLLQTCVQEIHDDGIETIPGDSFYYGPEHMHIAAAMAEVATGQSYVDIFKTQIVEPLNLSADTAFVNPSLTNPRASGGAESTANDYAEILRALMAGEIITDLSSFTQDRTANVSFGFRPNAVLMDSGDWHYGFGFWRECDDFVWQNSCTDDVVISSAGAFGWVPWIDFKADYFGLIATEDSEGGIIAVGEGPTRTSTALEQELQPLIETALQQVRN